MVAALRRRRTVLDHARRTGRVRRRAHRRVLPAAAAPGQPRAGDPGRPVRPDDPGPSGVEQVVWAPLVVLTLAIGLLPPIALDVADEPVKALIEAIS